MAETPQGCQAHQGDYKSQAWEAYTLAELGQWVSLFAKRAEHRTNLSKKDKDLHDAGNYLAMMQTKFDAIKQVRLDKFADIILRDLVEGNPKIQLTTVSRGCAILASQWKIPNDNYVRGFDDLYTWYIQPATLSLGRQLRDFSMVAHLALPPVEDRKGAIVSLHSSDKMSARFTTRYDSDGGGGPKAGTVMSIEVMVS